jgi:hypothetical protein
MAYRITIFVIVRSLGDEAVSEYTITSAGAIGWQWHSRLILSRLAGRFDFLLPGESSALKKAGLI